MNENKENLGTKISRRNQGPWWASPISIFSEISTWIAVPMVLALIIGKKLDIRYDTKPLWLLVSAGVGFLITALGIIKSVKKYAAKMKDSDKK